MTVADDNPNYPPDARVIVVAYRSDIVDTEPEMVAPDEPIPLRDLNEVGISHYSFPAPRLRFADPETDDIPDVNEIGDKSVPTTGDENVEAPEPDTESTEAAATDQDMAKPEGEDPSDEQRLRQLTEYLLDNGVRSEIDDGVIVAEKLGQTYEITLDGEVNGDGPYHDRLKQLVSDYSS